MRPQGQASDFESLEFTEGTLPSLARHIFIEASCAKLRRAVLLAEGADDLFQREVRIRSSIIHILHMSIPRGIERGGALNVSSRSRRRTSPAPIATAPSRCPEGSACTRLKCPLCPRRPFRILLLEPGGPRLSRGSRPPGRHTPCWHAP